MQVSRLATLNKLDIWQPRWKDKVVMLACHKVGDNNEIVFTKTPSMQGSYYVSGKVARSYPKESNGTISCYAVPIHELEPLERV